jgi:NADH:ubiquinone oxidoreductase subunit 5 (subunit L)/multisubunit Na+/H+ antiporter MnhA subunit
MGRIEPSGIRRIFELMSTMEDPINLSIGQAHYDAPPELVDAACRAMRAGFNRYTVTQGLPALNARILDDVASRYGKRPESSIVTAGVSGGIVQMISHGFISGAMFLCIGVLYDRVHSREIADYGGVVNTMPKFAAFAVFFAMANTGLPGTSGFVGEFMVILGAIQINFWYAFLAAFTLIFGAAYTLWMVTRVFYGAVANDQVAALSDLNKREFFILAVLALLVLALGVYPQAVTDMTNATVNELLTHFAQSKLPASLPAGL